MEYDPRGVKEWYGAGMLMLVLVVASHGLG